MILEYAYREKNKDPFKDDPKGDIRTEFKTAYHFDNVLNNFEAIKATKVADLKEGDLVVWRWTAGKGRDGHGMIYLAPIKGDANKFFGVSMNRKDDKSYEGVHIVQADLIVTDRETYVLRSNMAYIQPVVK